MKKINVNDIKEIIEEIGFEGEFNINDICKIYDVVTIGDERLRKKNKDITNINSIKNLIINMVNTLYDERGCGIAAPQIGQNINLFMVKVISKDEDGEEFVEFPLTIYINPEIIEYSNEKDIDYEGCLSVPGFYAKVERSKKIKIKYLDIDGTEHIDEYEGFTARAVQHEYDHLKGIVYTDIADMSSLTTVENFKLNK